MDDREQTDTKAAGPGTAVAFLVALVTFGGLFFLLDYALMSAQGLTLFFHG